jgi:hypothetical protein
MSGYFPIFRGKQFELIAVREFAQQRPNNRVVHPIIEPVRDPTEKSSLQRMISALEENDLRYTIIVNPGEGTLEGSVDGISKIVGHLETTDATVERMSFGILFHAGGADDALVAIEDSRLSGAAKNLIYDAPPIGPNDVGAMAGGQVGLHVAEDKGAVRALGNPFANGAEFVKLRDPFPRQKTNLDYVDAGESVFWSDHLYLGDDGFVGLADYLTIGNVYSEGGSLPLALVIHLTYQDPDSGLIYLRHFCSTSNADQSDPGGKFLEALARLVEFANSKELDNPALRVFRDYHAEKRFPGLGVIKKLSMQNHLYVMDEALGGT